ncbi:TPA: hypothetical protein KP562_001318 [Clostridioides difficile]|nr:hypothetical protein [Clostridioides difficile]
MSQKEVKCPKCKESIMVDDSKEVCFCVNCGEKIVVKDDVSNGEMNETKRIENILKLAKTSYEAGSMDDAYNYYCRILEYNPDDYKALFFKGLCAVRGSNLSDMRINETLAYVDKSWELLNKISTDESEIKAHKYRIVKELESVSEEIFYSASNFYSKNWECDGAAELYWSNLTGCMDVLFYNTNFLEYYFDLKNNEGLTVYLNSLNLIVSCCIEISEDRKNAWVDNDSKDKMEAIYNQTVEKIKLYDESYKAPQLNMTREVGGCYIATAVYGSYHAPEVMILRKFRDDVLSKYLLGRIFIKVYYTLSPPVANWLKDAKKVNLLVKNILDKFVYRLSNK